MTPLEKARALLKNLSFYQRVVVMNGVGSVLFWQDHYTRNRLIHHTLACVPVWFVFGLLLRGLLGDYEGGTIALLLIAITIPFGFVFYFAGRSVVRANRFIMENLSTFERVYFEHLIVYYIVMLVIAFVVYAYFF